MKDPFFQMFEGLHPEAKVLDVGCLDYSVYYRTVSRYPNLHHYGVDYMLPTSALPSSEYQFRQADLNKDRLPFENDFFDVLIASHILEHLQNPVQFFGECLRVLKPEGKLYISVPSEKSIRWNGMPFAREQFFSLSFYDDPTHQTRPWTPASLFRLAKLYSADPISVGYITSIKARLAFFVAYPYARIFKKPKLLEKIVWGCGWVSCAIVQKPKGIFGELPFRYYIPPR